MQVRYYFFKKKYICYAVPTALRFPQQLSFRATVGQPAWSYVLQSLYTRLDADSSPEALGSVSVPAQQPSWPRHGTPSPDPTRSPVQLRSSGDTLDDTLRSHIQDQVRRLQRFRVLWAFWLRLCHHNLQISRQEVLLPSRRQCHPSLPRCLDPTRHNTIIYRSVPNLGASALEQSCRL